MVLEGHARTAAWVAAGILFVGGVASGCGGGGGGGKESPTPTTTSASPTPTNRPANPAAAEKQIRDNWARFFSPATPIDQKAKYLENGDQLKQALQGFSTDPRTSQVAAQVTKVSFTSPTGADVTYVLTLKGMTQLPNAGGTSVLQDNVWKVSRQTFCGLIQLSGAKTPPPGC